MSNKVEDMALMAQLYPDAYTQVAPQQAGHVGDINHVGEGKPRRRRRKNKGGATGLSGLKKRKLSVEQVNLLELSFEDEHKLESERKDKLASELGLDPRQVAVWFQNRRARWKNKKLEDEYSKLKAAHDSAILEKCRLETEVLKLKDQLGDAKKEIQRLSERADVVSSDNNPSSPSFLSMEAIQPPFFGEFGMESYDNVFYLPESDCIINGMDWMYM